MDTADGDGDHEAGCSGDEDDDFCKDGVDGDGDGVEVAGFKYRALCSALSGSAQGWRQTRDWRQVNYSQVERERYGEGERGVNEL